MNYLSSILISSILLFSCNSADEPGQCHCTEQKFQRKVVSEVGTSNIISKDEWSKAGNPYSVGEKRCNDTDYIRSGENTNIHLIPGTNNASYYETEYRTTCR
ncbi:MAG: hypothetical protein ACN6OJ_15045, partial [Chryseobacterium sp.]|uniref:hypothetical protein n=1 Tax=Chryseobacterium sp. TaxID=1871047 RepID=UPI003D0AFD05